MRFAIHWRRFLILTNRRRLRRHKEGCHTNSSTRIVNNSTSAGFNRIKKLRGRTRVGQRWSLPIIYQIPLKSSFSDLPDPKRSPTGHSRYFTHHFPEFEVPIPGKSRKIQKCEKNVFSHFDILRAGYKKIVSISFNR